MPHVYRIHDKPYTVFDEKDIFYIIDEECSPEVSDIIREIITDLKEQADYTSQKVDTDLDCYEAQLDSYNSMCGDVVELLDTLDNYIEEAKKLDRQYILKLIGSIKKEIGNVF